MNIKIQEKHPFYTGKTPFFQMTSNLLKENYQKILCQIPENVQLVAVSKTQSAEKILNIYNLGQIAFGENKVQELVEKQKILPKDIHWHLIGHLQTNKVKYIAEFIDTIQSVDNEKLLIEIDKQAAKHQRKIKILLQVKIAEEDTKFGMSEMEVDKIFLKWLEGNFSNIEITGLMGMATFTEDITQLQQEFSFLKKKYDQLSLLKPLETLSMGMSGDFLIAIACGANSVRVGSAIFGNRN